MKFNVKIFYLILKYFNQYNDKNTFFDWKYFSSYMLTHFDVHYLIIK